MQFTFLCLFLSRPAFHHLPSAWLHEIRRSKLKERCSIAESISQATIVVTSSAHHLPYPAISCSCSDPTRLSCSPFSLRRHFHNPSLLPSFGPIYFEQYLTGNSETRQQKISSSHQMVASAGHVIVFQNGIFSFFYLLLFILFFSISSSCHRLFLPLILIHRPWMMLLITSSMKNLLPHSYSRSPFSWMRPSFIRNTQDPAILCLLSDYAAPERRTLITSQAVFKMTEWQSCSIPDSCHSRPFRQNNSNIGSRRDHKMRLWWLTLFSGGEVSIILFWLLVWYTRSLWSSFYIFLDLRVVALLTHNSADDRSSGSAYGMNVTMSFPKQSTCNSLGSKENVLSLFCLRVSVKVY